MVRRWRKRGAVVDRFLVDFFSALSAEEGVV